MEILQSMYLKIQNHTLKVVFVHNIEEQVPLWKKIKRTSAGFQCFVCGTRYASNKELIEHLVKGSHGGMYDTGSPQEAEDAGRCRIII
jgi:hypothetical protein